MQDASAEQGDNVTKLDRARSFFKKLYCRPFVAIVFDNDGKVYVYSRGAQPMHLHAVRAIARDLAVGE